MKKWITWVLVMAMALLAPTALASETILIAAAASLEKTMAGELIPLFESLYPDIKVEGTYDSSGKLQTQIEEGLEADVFISAANKQMNALVETGLIDPETAKALLENRIVLIAAMGSETAVDSFENILSADSIAIGDPQSVPAGQYAQEILTALGLYEETLGKASLGGNVTEVLNWVAEESAQVGIVYATDAAQMPDRVRVIAYGTPAQPVIYPMGVVAASIHKDAVACFMAFLESDEAMAIFAKAGFERP